MILCLILILLLIVTGIAVGLESYSDKRHYKKIEWISDKIAACGLICSIIYTIVFVMLAIILLVSNYNSRIDLEVFYNTNTQNYADTVNMSNNILLQAKFTEGLTITGEGLAYQGQSTEVTKAIVEWRDAINEYNSKLANYKGWQSNPWTSWFYYHTDAEYLPIR